MDGDGDGVKVWTFPVDGYVVAVSLQSPPENFEARVKTAKRLVESLQIPRPETKEKGEGVIEFRVE